MLTLTVHDKTATMNVIASPVFNEIKAEDVALVVTSDETVPRFVKGRVLETDIACAAGD
jgi:hypothetical protein